MRVSAIVPCYRSATTLPSLVEQLVDVLQENTDEHEVILVVDGSPDDTWDVARALASEWKNVRALRLSRNYGQHNALLAGVRSVAYDVVVTLDDDLQHPPAEIPRLLGKLTEEVDLVYGVPVEEEHGIVRSLASRTVKAAMTRGLGIDNARSISAFRAFRTYLRDGFEGLNGPHASVDVALSWSTTRVQSVSVRMDRRAEGASNYSFRLLVRHALNMLLGYSSAPLRVVGLLGLACGLLGAALLGAILWKFFTGETSVAGFTTIASMVAMFSGAQMLAIGVLGEYVGRVHSSNLGRPTYVIRERTDDTTMLDINSGAARSTSPRG